MTTSALLTALFGGLVGALVGSGTTVGVLVVSLRHQAREYRNERVRKAYAEVQFTATRLSSIVGRFVTMFTDPGPPVLDATRLFDQADTMNGPFIHALSVLMAEDAPPAVLRAAFEVFDAVRLGDPPTNLESWQAVATDVGGASLRLSRLIEVDLRQMKQNWWKRRQNAVSDHGAQAAAPPG